MEIIAIYTGFYSDPIDRARALIEQSYTVNPTITNKTILLADGYIRSLRFLKAFLEEEYPELLSQASPDIPSEPKGKFLKSVIKKLEAEKKPLYRGYRELKDRRMELLMAKDNIERFLGINRNEPERTTEREQKHKQSHER